MWWSQDSSQTVSLHILYSQPLSCAASHRIHICSHLKNIKINRSSQIHQYGYIVYCLADISFMVFPLLTSTVLCSEQKVKTHTETHIDTHRQCVLFGEGKRWHTPKQYNSSEISAGSLVIYIVTPQYMIYTSAPRGI